MNEYLQSIKTNNEMINFWIDHNLRNYLQTYGYISNELKLDIEHAIGYLRTQKRVKRISVPQAIRSGKLLLEQEQRKATDQEGKIEVVCEIDQFKIVRLLDEQALKREGKLMQHCVGSEQQDYIDQVISGEIEILSLRDTHNNPHCTIEIENNTIEQIKGKQNKHVVRKYQNYVKQFVLESNYECDDHELLNIGVLVVDGIKHDLYNLPDNLTINGSLDLRNTQITKLPNNLTVGGYLDLSNTQITQLPDNLTVNGWLAASCTQITSLSDTLTVGGSLYLGKTQITKLPNNLSAINGVLDLRDTPITELSNNLTVHGDLMLSRTQITKLPENLTIDGNLYIINTKITELPSSLTVKSYTFRS